jgi:hypothetical protein
MRHAFGLLLSIIGCCLGIGLILPLISSPGFTQEAADLLLTNGKIVTVDDRFTIAQALAIKGSRRWAPPPKSIS